MSHKVPLSCCCFYTIPMEQTLCSSLWNKHFAVVADDPCDLVPVNGVELRERLQDEEEADAARAGDRDHVRHALKLRQVPELIEDKIGSSF